MLLPSNQYKTLNMPSNKSVIDNNLGRKVENQYFLEPTEDNIQGDLGFRLVETNKRTLEKQIKQQSVFPVDYRL